MRKPKIVTLLILVMSTLFAGNAFTQPKAPPLLQLVDQNVGVCIQIDNFADQWQLLEQTRFYRQLLDSQLFRHWQQSRQHQQLKKTISEIEKATGDQFREIIKDLFGQSVLMAIYPIENAEPEVILLTHVKPGSSLSTLLSAWEQDKKNSVEQRTYQGRSYTRNQQNDESGNEKSTAYYLSAPGLFAYTEKEDLLKQVIDHWKDNKQSLERSRHFKTTMQTHPGQAAIKVYVNPRRWDDDLQQQDPEDTGHAAILAAWKNLQQLSATVKIDNGLHANIIARYNNNSVPDEVKTALNKLSGPAANTLPVPPHAFCSIRGKHDLNGMVNAVVARMGEKETEKWNSFQASIRGILMGWDLQSELLPALSPNWGLVITPKTEPDSDHLLIDLVAALEIDQEKAEQVVKEKSKVKSQTAIDNAFQFGMNMLVTTINLQGKIGPCELKIKETEQGRLRWITGLPYVAPAAAVFGNKILIATNPDAILPDKTDTDHHDSVFPSLASRYFPNAGHTMALNFREIREYMKANKEILIDQASKTKPHARAEIEKRLTNLYHLLTMADHAYTAAQVTDGEMKFSLGLATSPED